MFQNPFMNFGVPFEAEKEDKIKNNRAKATEHYN